MAKKLAFDKVLFATVMLLLGFGLVMVNSASAVVSSGETLGLATGAFYSQLAAAGLGLVGMLVAMQLDYRPLRKRWLLYPFVCGALVLLVVVLYSPMLNESRRWIVVGGVSVQASELAKVALVFFVAYQLDRKWERVNHPSFLIPTLLAVGTTGLLVLLEPDFGTAGVLMLVAGLLLFLGGVAWRYVGIAALLTVPAFWLLVLSVPYRLERILAFLRPEDDSLGSGWQVIQSLIAVGSGGTSGLGLGESVQKLHFLPLANSDFIYAIVCEELGLLGAGGVLLLFSVLAWRGVLAGQRAPDIFGRFIAWGLTCTIVVQALIHVSIALGLLPTTGLPLPLISHGGSSLVATLTACGVVLNVSQHA